MHNPTIVLIGFTTAAILVGICFLRSRDRIERRVAQRMLALIPPTATLLMAIVAGSKAAALPLFIFGGVIGLLAALSVDQFWYPI